MRQNRAWLGFAPAVEDAFSFLLADGFQIVESAPTIVRYKKGGACVTLFHGRRSWEIGLEVGPKGGERFSIGGILEAAGAERPYLSARRHRDRWPASINGYIRSPISSVGTDSPPGSWTPYFLERMRQQTRDWWAAFNLDSLADRNRPRAAAAFREGRYREAAELYEEMAARLDAGRKEKVGISAT